MNYGNWAAKLQAKEASPNKPVTAEELREAKEYYGRRRGKLVVHLEDNRATRRSKEETGIINNRGGFGRHVAEKMAWFHLTVNAARGKAKKQMPLTDEEKLFYGIRKNPTPRALRNYPTINPKKLMHK